MPTLKELAKHVGGDIHGAPDCEIDKVATLEKAGPGDISFLSNPRYRKQLADTSASAVVIAREDVEVCTVSAVVVDNPYLAYARIAALLQPDQKHTPGIDKTASVSDGNSIDASAYIGPHAVIESGVNVGANVFIGAGCFIGCDSSIGKDSRILANVSICHKSIIGERAIIHPGVVIGSDGFGLANDDGVWVKIPQVGRTIIGNDVEIGANTTIDCGALEDTVLEDGVKLDNQIQIAHNVHIGAHTAIAGCTAIAGSTRIGSYCSIAGAVGIIGHLDIADHVHITAMTLVTHSIDQPGSYSTGTALEETVQWRKNAVRFKQLDEMARRLANLEKKFKATD